MVKFVPKTWKDTILESSLLLFLEVWVFVITIAGFWFTAAVRIFMFRCPFLLLSSCINLFVWILSVSDNLSQLNRFVSSCGWRSDVLLACTLLFIFLTQNFRLQFYSFPVKVHIEVLLKLRCLQYFSKTFWLQIVEINSRILIWHLALGYLLVVFVFIELLIG